MAFNILYKGRKIYQDLSYEDCMEVLDNLSQEYYQNEDYDINEIELEEI
jgi:Lhr-like helicase